MKKNIYEDLTDENLLKKSNQLKSISIGFMILFVLSIGSVFYLIKLNGIEHISIAPFIAVLTSPIILFPLLIYYGKLDKEIRSRKL